MEFRLLKGFDNVFMNDITGEIFTVKSGRDLPLKVTPCSKKPTININGKGYKVLDLILSTYDFTYSDTDRISFKIGKTGFISPKSVKIKSSGSLTEGDESLCIHYKCNIKASSANCRFKDKISSGTILQVLKIADFKCIYCGCDIDPNDWHLAHYHPRAFGGVNTLENIVPACSVCNKMKGALDGVNFLKRCKNICINNKILSSKERYKFKTEWDGVMKDRETALVLHKAVKFNNHIKQQQNG